jgi:hypothetical protein
MASQPDYRVLFDPFHIQNDTFGRYRFKMRLTEGPDTFEDFAGCTFKGNLMQGDTVILQCTTANGRMGLITGAEATEFEIADNEGFWWEVEKADAEVLVVGKYKYDIEVTYPDGTVRTRVYGTLTVKIDRSE